MTYAVRYYTQTGNTKRLAEAIAKELGVEINEITKFGGDSKILYERTK